MNQPRTTSRKPLGLAITDQIRRVIRETIEPADGTTIDGQGAVFQLPPRWNGPAIRITSDRVTVRDLTIVAAPDSLGQVAGMIHATDCRDLRLENVRLIGAGSEPPIGPYSLPLYCHRVAGLTITGCEFAQAPRSWNVQIDWSTDVVVRDSVSHHAYLDGFKLATGSSRVVFDSCFAYGNGRGGGTGDGLDVCHGASGSVDVSNCHFYENGNNGITFKFGPWQGASQAGRARAVWFNVRGGSLNDNQQSGFFCQGYSGDPPAGANGSTAPWPQAINCTGTTAEGNGEHGFLIGAGAINLVDVVAYRNKHGVTVGEQANGCQLVRPTAIANAETNLNIWARRTDVDHARCYGRDVLAIPSASWSSSPAVTDRGINYQWKPARGGHHGIFTRCTNEGATRDNDKPAHLPADNWIE